MSFKFENLRIWNESMDLGEDVNLLISSFPDKERFNLSSQMIRAVDSIALNISEGSIDQSDAEYNRFLGYSVRSIAEVATCLHKAKRRNYLSEEHFEKLYSKCFKIMNMILAFKKNLR